MAHFTSFRRCEDKVAYANPLPVRLPGCPVEKVPEPAFNKAPELQSMARLLEDLIPKAKNECDRQFCRVMAEKYKTSAREILRRASRIYERSYDPD